MDSFLENLEQDVHCSLCNDTLTEPKILKCSHTFCKHCIKRNADLIEEINVFSCPKCKSQTRLPKLNSVDVLNPSPRHLRILECLEFLKSEKFCSVCERKPQATWYCLDRQRLLCKDCAKPNSIINKEQQYISLTAELTEADIKRILTKENLCQNHEQVYEFFCKDCKEFICIYCFRSRLCREHETVPIAEGSLQDFLVKEAKEKLKAKKEEIQKNIEKHKEIISTRKKDGERAKAEIEETMKQLTKMLQLLKKSKQELDEDIDERIEEAEQKSKKDQEELVRIDWASDYIAELKKFGVVSEICKATQNMEVPDQSSNTAIIDAGSRFKFVKSDECFRFLRSKRGLGSLELVDMTTAIHVEPELEALKEAKLTLAANEASPEKQEGIQSVCTSDVTGAQVKTSQENESKEAEKHPRSGGKNDEVMNAVAEQQLQADASGETNRISLRTKTAREKPIANDPHVDVKISPEENVEIRENYMRIDGKIEVEFMAKVAGQLTAEVRVNGKHVSNSPLVMNVQPHQMKITGEFDTKRQSEEKPALSRFAGMAVNKDSSRIAVTDWATHCVHVFNNHENHILTHGGKGSGEGQLHYPQGLAFVNETDLVIADSDNHRICILSTTTGTLIKTFGNQGNGDGEFNEPHGVHVDDESNIFVCDHDNHRVQVFTRDGDYQYQFCLEEVDHFSPLALLKIQDKFYVSDFSNNVIHVFERKNSVVRRISTIGEKGNADGQLSGPCGLAIDDDHHLLVCDNGNNRIQKFTLDGRLVGKTYDKIENPYEIAVGKDGVLASTGSKISIVR